MLGAAQTAAHRYLLDTNIVSDLVRDPHGAVARRIVRAGESAVCTSIVVACELRYGAAKKGSPRLSAQLESILKPRRYCRWNRIRTATMEKSAPTSSAWVSRSVPMIC